MNIIEQTVEPKNGVIDIHVDVPAEWNGKRIKIRVILEEDEQNIPIVKPKSDLTRFGGKYAYLPESEKKRMIQELDNMRNEWERDI